MESSEVSFQYELWKDSYFEENLKDFPCPHCKTGRSSLKKDTLSILEPAYSKGAHSHEAFELDWIDERFIGFLQCNNSNCGEFSAISGYVEWYYYIDYEEDEQNWDRRFYVKNIYPAPPIILLPDETPKPVKQEIEKSFALFWNDRGACANNLRKSVERLLDDLKIPSAAKNKRGEEYLIKLSERIDEFKKINTDHSETLDALRIVGNVGSHEETISSKTILDAFYIYEDSLAELYGNRSTKIKELKKKIIESKGRYIN